MTKAIGTLAIALTLFVVGALLQSLALHVVWDAFVAHQYGPGPSLGAWYGLAVLLAIPLSVATFKLPRTEGKGFADAALQTIGLWIGTWISVGVAVVVGLVLGWV